MNKRKIIINITGPNGSGKTTIARKIQNLLELEGYDVSIMGGCGLSKEAIFEISKSHDVAIFDERVGWLEKRS